MYNVKLDNSSISIMNAANVMLYNSQNIVIT